MRSHIWQLRSVRKNITATSDYKTDKHFTNFSLLVLNILLKLPVHLLKSIPFPSAILIPHFGSPTQQIKIIKRWRLLYLCIMIYGFKSEIPIAKQRPHRGQPDKSCCDISKMLTWKTCPLPSVPTDGKTRKTNVKNKLLLYTSFLSRCTLNET